MYSVVIYKGFFSWIVYLDNPDNGPWLIFDSLTKENAIKLANDIRPCVDAFNMSVNI